MAAINADGRVVTVGDKATAVGLVASIVSGTGPLATVAVTPMGLGGGTSYNIRANDARAKQHPNDSLHTVQDEAGNYYGVGNDANGDQVSVDGVVTAVSGSGNSALLTVTTNSGLSVSIPAGSVHSPATH